MNCEDFEMLMADALGGELASGDRPEFDRHLAECKACRTDFETSQRAIEEMRALPGTQKVTARREGNRLVIDAASLASVNAARSTTGGTTLGASSRRKKVRPGRTLPDLPSWATTPLRYAAGLLIAFTAGYALHAGLTLADAARTSPIVINQPAPPGESLQGSLAKAHARKPGRSNLAKCLIAMAATRR